MCGLGEAGPPEPRTAQNELPDAFWEPLGHQSPEQLKISLQRTSGSHVATRAQNATAFPGLGGPAAAKLTSGSDFFVFNLLKGAASSQGKSHGASDLKRTAWEKPDHQSPEQLKMSSRMHSGSHLATRAQNSSKSASKGHLGATWPPEPRTPLPFLALVAQRLPS